MAAKTKARKSKKVTDPWSDVGGGSHLHIGHFLTFQLIRLANAAKSNVTRRYLAELRPERAGMAPAGHDHSFPAGAVLGTRGQQQHG